MDKSHVSLEQKICVVTGQPYDTDSILLDRRLEESMEQHTVTGWGISPEVQEMFDQGFIALIGIDPERSKTLPNGNIDVNHAYRTGNMAYLKREVAEELFNLPISEFQFVDDVIIQQLKEIQNAE